MSRNVSSFYYLKQVQIKSLVSQSGCKSTTSFLSRKCFKIFFEKFTPSFSNPLYSLNNSMNLLPFGSAKIITLFVSDKSFFEKILNPLSFQFTSTPTMNFIPYCGCKSNTSFLFLIPFFDLFFMYFSMR